MHIGPIIYDWNICSSSTFHNSKRSLRGNFIYSLALLKIDYCLFRISQGIGKTQRSIIEGVMSTITCAMNG